ncbi:MAG: glucose 1-dehydrogenase [Eubacteriales bacterium]|nr:glucose 1-dehydrogenase [Eubacteriales bacterium]
MKFVDKSIVVTGAGNGMGKEITLRYLKEGANVVAVDLKEDALNVLKEEVAKENFPGKLEIFVGDISKQENAEGMITYAVEQFGKLDILVNNAGIGGRYEPIGELDNDLWERIISVNLTGTMYAMRKAVNVMLEQEHGGNIVNIASMAGLKGCRASSAYTASKHGVIGLTEHTAFMYLHKGIRCNAICPGAIKTDMSANHEQESAFGFERVKAGMDPVVPYGTPKNIADAVLFITSDDASFITGASLTVDGGISCN